MRPWPREVPGVQQGLPAALHVEHVAVKGGVVAQVRRNGQRTHPDGLPVFQKSGRVQRFSAQVVIGRPQYLPGPAAQVEGDVWVGLLRQAM